MKKLIKAMNIKYLIIAPILIAISVIAETWTPVNSGPSRSPFYNQVQFWNAVISTNGAGDTVLNTVTSYDPILAMNSILMTDGSGTYAIACRPLDGGGAAGVDLTTVSNQFVLKTDTGTRSTEPTATSYTVLYNNSMNSYILDWTNGVASDTTYNLSKGNNTNLYSDFTFINLTTNLLIIQANADDYIIDSGKGKTIYSGVALSNIGQYASITLRLVRSNSWMATSMFGTWTTTE